MRFKIIKILAVVVMAFGAKEVFAQRGDISFARSSYVRSNPAKAALEYYMKGKEQAVMGDSTRVHLALTYFAEAYKLDSTLPALLFEISKVYGDERGISYATKALEGDSTNFWYASHLAEKYAMNNNFKSAIHYVKHAISLDKDNAEPYNDLATYYYYAKHTDSAYNMIDTIATRFGASPEVASLHINMIKSEPTVTPDMVEKVEEYATLYTDISYFHNELGAVYLRVGRVDDAEAQFFMSKELDPTDLLADVSLFDLYYRTDRINRAMLYLPSFFKMPDVMIEYKLDMFNNLLVNNMSNYMQQRDIMNRSALALLLAYPDNTQVRDLYIKYLVNTGEVNSALIMLKPWLVDGTISREGLFTLTEAYAFYKEYPSAISTLERGREILTDEKKDIDRYLIAMLVEAGSYNEAITMLKQAIKGESDSKALSELYCQLGDTYGTVGQVKKAYAAYKKAMKLDIMNIVAKNNYSYLMSNNGGDLDEALRLAKEVINREPSSATYLDTYAWVLYRRGEYEEARKVLSKAVALDTTNSVSLLRHYGDVLNAMGRESLAKLYWQKATDAEARNTEAVEYLKEEYKRLNDKL